MPIAFNYAVGAVTLVIGIFVTISPVHAARLWGWKHLNDLTPQGRNLYLAGYRALGILLSLAGAFVALQGFWSP